MRKSSSLAVAVVSACSLLAAASSSRGATATTTLFDSGGFEPSASYAPGPLTGQPTAAAGNAQWNSSVSNAGTSFPVAVVATYGNSSVPNSPVPNTQYVQVSDSGLASTDFGYYFPNTNLANPFTPSPTVGQQVAIRWTMAVSAAVAATSSPFFGVTAYNGNTRIADAGINGTTGTLSTGNDVNFAQTTPFSAAAGTFYQYELLLDYSTQKFSIFEAPAVVGSTFTQLGSGPFLSTATQFTDADIASYGLTTAGNVNGLAQFDNYSVQTTGVPEPMSLSTAAAGLLVLAGRRKSRSVVDAGAGVR